MDENSTTRRGPQHSRYDGISLEDRWKAFGRRLGKRWMVKVRDRRLQGYRRRMFDDQQEAMKWARTERAKLELGESSAGRWPLAIVTEECLRLHRHEGGNQVYIRALERHSQMLASVGVHDLADDGLLVKVRRYLDLPTTEGHRRTTSDRPAGSTVKQRFAYLRTLVAHARNHLGMRIDPLAGFVMPAAARKANRSGTADQATYTLDEVRSVLVLDRRDDPSWLAFTLSVYTGLRRAELVALRWEHLDWRSRTLRVLRGKGGKARVVPMQPELADLLSSIGGPTAEVTRVGPVCVVEGAGLTIQQHLRPLLEVAGVAWDRGTSAVTGLPDRLTWHACRRTCAAAQLAAGVDGLEIQRALGHAQSSLTGEYAGAFTRWKHQVEEEGWPKGRLCYLPRQKLAAVTSENA